MPAPFCGREDACRANDAFVLRGHGTEILEVTQQGRQVSSGLRKAAAAGPPVVKTLMLHQCPSPVQLRPDHEANSKRSMKTAAQRVPILVKMPGSYAYTATVNVSESLLPSPADRTYSRPS